MSMTDTTESARMSYEDRMANFCKWLQGHLTTLRSVLEFIKRVMDKVRKVDTGKDPDISYICWVKHELDGLNERLEEVDTSIEVEYDLIRDLSRFKMVKDPELRDLDSTLTLCTFMRWSLRYFMLLSFHFNSSLNTMNVPELKIFDKMKKSEMSFLKEMVDAEMKVINSVSSHFDSIMKVCQSMEIRLSKTNTDPEPEMGNFESMSTFCKHLKQTVKDFKSIINLAMTYVKSLMDLEKSKIDTKLIPCGYIKWNMRDDNIPKELDDILKHDISEFYTLMSLIRVQHVNNVASIYDTEDLLRTYDNCSTPLQLACESGNLELAIWFCRPSNPESCTNIKNDLSIHNYCSSGELGVVKYLRQQGCDIETPGNLGNRPLHLAAEHGRLNVVEYLCRHKCNVDAPNDMSWMPIHFACRGGHLDIVKHLLKEGCNRESFTAVGQQPLHLACVYGHLDIVRYLCEQGCSKEACTALGQEPLHLACTYGHLEIVRFLKDHNCNIETATSDAIAEEHGQQQSNIENLTMLSYDPIHVAILNGHIDIVRYLCQKRCDIMTITKMGESVLDLAIQNGRDDIHKLLSEEKLKRQRIKKISNMKMECGNFCQDSFCFKKLYDTKSNNEALINQSRFGCTFKMEDPELDYTYCVKFINLDPNECSQCTEFETRIDKYVKFLYPERIVQYFGKIRVGQEMFIFMEHLEGMSLDKHISERPLPHSKVIQYSRQILEGLNFLHQNKIIHRDIKPKNIMVNNDHVKICNFGLSCCLESIGQGNQTLSADSSTDITIFGTPNYMAPELITDEIYSYPVDIWALGASVVEMLTGVRPFHRIRVPVVIFKIGTERKIEFVPAEPMSPDMKSFVDQMLCPCPSTRATAEVLLKFIGDKFLIGN